MTNLKDVPMVRCFYLIFQGFGFRTDVREDLRTVITAKIISINGLSNFVRYGAPLVNFRRALAPLQQPEGLLETYFPSPVGRVTETSFFFSITYFRAFIW